MDMATEQMMEYLQNESAKLITDEILKAFHKGQKVYKADYFGFGEIVKKNFPSYWRENSEDWDDIFSSAQVNIEVHSNIRRSGQILKPSEPQ